MLDIVHLLALLRDTIQRWGCSPHPHKEPYKTLGSEVRESKLASRARFSVTSKITRQLANLM